MILQEDEHEAEHENSRGVLVVEPEQQVVDAQVVGAEPLEKVLEDGQLPEGHGRRHVDRLATIAIPVQRTQVTQAVKF